MTFIKLFFKASYPLFILIYFWSSGTSTSEYEANFRKITGLVKGPYLLIYENFHLITNDTLEWTSNSYSKFESSLREHDLTRSYFQFVNKVKSHDMNWDTNPIDSLSAVPSQMQWNKLKEEVESIVYSEDTILFSDYIYEVEVPVKLSVVRSMSARVYFSLGDYPDKFQIKFPIKNSESMAEDLPAIVKAYSAKSGQLSKEHAAIKTYFNELEQFIGKHKTLSVKILKPHLGGGRAYKVWDEKNKLIFEDEIGLEGLEHSGEQFILWYDNWLVKFLIGLQLLFYISVSSELIQSIKERK